MNVEHSNIDNNNNKRMTTKTNLQFLKTDTKNVHYSIIKTSIVVLTIFIAFYFLMNDLKTFEVKKITYYFFNSAQENIRILESAGESINKYISNNKKLNRADIDFIWDIIHKSRLAKALIWNVEGSDGWYYIFADNNKYKISKYSTDNKRTKEFVRKISALPRSKTNIDIKQLRRAFPNYNLTGNYDYIPLLFTKFKKSGGFDFLIILANIKNIFLLNDNNSDLVLHNVKFNKAHDKKILLEYNYQNTDVSFFKPISLKYDVMMGGETWNVDMTVSPTMAYITFLTLPWIILICGIVVIIGNGIYVHKQYRQENQLAHISETLADKNTELLSWENERKQMIKEFRKSELEYKAIINAVSDVIFEVNQYGNFLFINETWQKLFNKNVDDGLNTNIFTYLHDKDRIYHEERFGEFVSGYKGAYRGEARFRLNENNEYRFVELAFSMMRVTDAEPRVVGTITDIEKRKRAEIAHKTAEKRYEEMFKNALNGIYQETPDGKFINVNQAFADILGYLTPQEFIEDINNNGKKIYASEKQRTLLEMQTTQKGVVEGVEVEIIKQDGSKAWLLENIRSVYDDNGDVAYFEGTVWDITKRKEIDQALRSAKLEADLTSRARIEFMANMSHELRTPLNAVIGFSEIIRNEVMGPIEQDAYKEYAEDIHNSGKQLLSIINDILELSQIEIGERELKEKEFPVARIIQSVLNLLEHKIKHGKLKVNINIPEDMPNIFAEELAFKQIFMNIIGNAVKFTPENGKINIFAKLGEDGSMIIEISDSGVGMTEDELEKALQPFGQVETDMARDNSGTGLGLSIVQALVELHGGRFLIMSEKNKGTTIKLEFPKERTMLRSVS